MRVLTKTIGVLQGKGLTGNDLAAAWVSRRIQLLQAGEKPMWAYTGSDDPTRVNPNELEEEEFVEKMKLLTMVRENLG